MKGIRFYCYSALFALLALALGGPAKAESTFRGDGNDLLRGCLRAVESLDKHEKLFGAYDGYHAGYCMGMVKGIWTWRAAIFSEKVGFTTPVCFPKQPISDEQGVRVVLKYLKDSPESLHLDDAVLVVVALAKAFPCKQ